MCSGTWNAFEFQNKYIIISPGRHNTPSTYSSAGVVVLNSFDINNNNISNKYSNKANIPSFFGTSLVWFLSRFEISSHFLADPIQHIRIGCRGGAEGKVSRSSFVRQLLTFVSALKNGGVILSGHFNWDETLVNYDYYVFAATVLSQTTTALGLLEMVGDAVQGNGNW